MEKNIKLSVAIPTYEQENMSGEFLRHSFNQLVSQTFKDFEVVICDDSKNEVVKNLCEEYSDRLNIRYHKNKYRLGLSANTNSVIKSSKGELIKILFMDDYLYHKDALKDIVDAFRGNWLVTGSEHSADGVTCFRPFFPFYNHQIHTGINTISSPSVLTIKNDKPLLFDENLIWLMDCDYYKRCYEKFGEPTILRSINVVNRLSKYQTTNTLLEEVKRAEVKMLTEKYV